jgi:alginate O-acetyltransferase complex protein AlgI
LPTIGQHHAISQSAAWLAVFGYYGQLYFDFSGYSDMALGLARMFGIIFPINFFSPLKSVGIVDFYRRWHMTLTRVISRFLYSPLSLWGARFAARRGIKGPAARMLQLWLPLLINFEVIGLWHGATYTFVLFGLIHGVWYILETEVRGTKRWRKYVKATPSLMRHILGRMIFTVPMALTFALFRCESVPAFGTLVRHLFVADPTAPAPVGLLIGFAWVGGALAVIHLLPNSVELLRRYRPGIMTYINPFYGFRLIWRPNLIWTTYWTTLVIFAMYFVWRQPPFLYMGF